MNNWNGLPPVIGTQHKPVNASSNVIPMLPSFNSWRYNDASNRLPALASRSGETLRKQRLIDQRYRLELHRKAMAKADARRRAVSNLLLMLFVVVSCGLAAVTLRMEQQQQQQVQQLQ